MKTKIALTNPNLSVISCGAFINDENRFDKKVEVYLEFWLDDESYEVFFDVDLSDTKFWKDSYGVEGSPVWVDSDIADTMKLSLTEDCNEYDVTEETINYLITHTYEDVQKVYLELKAQEEGDY